MRLTWTAPPIRMSSSTANPDVREPMSVAA